MKTREIYSELIKTSERRRKIESFVAITNSF